MKQRGWGVPLLLGVVTAILLALTLWQNETAQTTVVVAARDLGAGAQLTAADLVLKTLPEPDAPADAVTNAASLLGETLTVVRFAGEPVTLRQIGEAVTLANDERGVAVKVSADTGLAGLLRPGMSVGVVATLPDAEGATYAKALLEGLRVLYVPPDFQARPYTPISAQSQVSNGTASTSVVNSSSPAQVDSGVVVLAVSTQPMTVTYQLPSAGLDGLQSSANPPTERVVTPVELLAALNAANAAFTLVLTPDKPQAYTTLGLSTATLLVKEGQP